MRHRPQRLVGDDAAAVVDVQPGCGGQRRHPHARGPQHGLCGNDLAVGERYAVRQHLDDIDARATCTPSRSRPARRRARAFSPIIDPGSWRPSSTTSSRDAARRSRPPIRRRSARRLPRRRCRRPSPVQLVGEHRRVLLRCSGCRRIRRRPAPFGVGDTAERVDQGVVVQRVAHRRCGPSACRRRWPSPSPGRSRTPVPASRSGICRSASSWPDAV